MRTRRRGGGPPAATWVAVTPDGSFTATGTSELAVPPFPSCPADPPPQASTCPADASASANDPVDAIWLILVPEGIATGTGTSEFAVDPSPSAPSAPEPHA
jgi:hypothetical protein